VYACREGDILHCNDLNALPVGTISKLLRRKQKVIYDAHEYETETMNMQGWRKKGAILLERMLIGYADRVITVSESIAEAYVKRYGIVKPALILNTPLYVNNVSKRDLFRKRFDIAPNQVIFLYQGSLSAGRGIEHLIEAFTMLGDTSAVIVFMGYGPLEEYLQEKARTYRNIFLHEAVAPEKVLEYTSSADFGFSMIEDCCLSYRYCLPNKLFEYAMAEIPVIVSNLPEMRRIVRHNGIGIVLEKDDPQCIVRAVSNAIEKGSERFLPALKRFKRTYCWEEQEKALIKIYETVCDDYEKNI
jgi:glycosyltransferase involved in cell wall biosynthesis